MKKQVAVIVLTVLLASVFTSYQSTAAFNNRYSLTMQLDKDTYMLGEIIELSGSISPLKDQVPLVIEVLDPSSNVHLATEVLPEPGEDDNGVYSYQIELGADAPVGLWAIKVKYAGQYTLYARADLSFRVSDSIDILTSPSLQVSTDGIIDSSSGEWAHKYDSKYWKPFDHDPKKIEGNIAFSAYYSNGVLYAAFDVPDKRFDSADFVELGLDLNNVEETFKVGDEVYIFRVFRDGTYDSFRLGSEYLVGEKSVKHYFSAKAKEAGDIRLQVFDADGNLVKALNSLRDTSSTSYKGMLGIAGIEVDEAGNLYILDSDSGTIIKFNPEGELLGSFGSLGTELKEFIDPTGIAMDPEGNIYVADTGNARVQKFDRNGRFLGAFGSMGLLSVGAMQIGDQKPEESKRHDLFESPEGIVSDLSDNVYIVDRRTGSVNVFDSDGNYISSFGEMVSPKGIARDSTGKVYVVEQGNNRILKFDASGKELKSWGTFGIDDGFFKAPYGIAIDSSDRVYVTDSVNNRIQIFDSDGNFIAKWGVRGTSLGQFIGPHGLAIDSSDNIYVADTGNNRIQKFHVKENFTFEITEWGSKGSDPGSFIRPEAIATDSQGNVYVTDFNNKRIQKFSGDGTFLLEWGSSGVGAGEFRGPFGIAIDGSDSVYVTDPLNRRVQKFDTSGNLLLRWGSNEVREEVSLDDIPKGDHYIALDSNSHEPIGVIDTRIVEEYGRGTYILESGKIWKLQHIFRDTVYVKPVDYAKDAILSWTPDGIDVDTYGNVYIVDRENEIAKKFGGDGRLILKWGSTGTGDGEFSKPTAMTIDSKNSLYIVDTGNNRVQKFDSEGNFITKWGTYGQERGQFNDPRGIAVDAQDHVYVLDNDNNRVQKFDSDGEFVKEWGSQGSSAGQFDNLSTEGIAADSQGRIYVADLPGEAKATHWIAEVAIPLFAETDTFGLYLAEGMYGSGKALNGDARRSVTIYDVYRSAWPGGAITILPETWAKAKLIDLEEVMVEPAISIGKMRACTDQACAELDSAEPVLTGNRVIVTASIGLEQAPDKFEYDRTKMTLQYSYDDDGLEWLDADSRFVTLSRDDPATVNLKWMPIDSGEAKLRITSSGLLAKETQSDPFSLEVLESESFRLRADLDWKTGRVIQGTPVPFELTFAGADSTILEKINYELRIINDGGVVAELLPSTHSKDEKIGFDHTFTEAGLHIMQVRVLGLGNDDNFMPTKKDFNYRINVLPVEKPLQVSSIQRGEAMKIIIKNSDMSSVQLNSITLSLANIDEVAFELPEGWSASVSTAEERIGFSTEDDPLNPGDAIQFILRSQAFADSLYGICWDLEQSSLVVKLC